MSRRDLLRRTLLITGSIPTSASVLLALGCGDDDDVPTSAATQPASSPTEGTTATTAAPPASSPSAQATGTTAATGDVQTEEIDIEGPGSRLKGHLARPDTTNDYPGILVIHENRGLNDHIRNVADRYASEGFVALAVDLVSRAGGSTSDTAANTGALGSAKVEDLVADLQAYAEHLQSLNVREGGIGVIGFCFGGGYTWEAIAAVDNVVAAAPYYGTTRSSGDNPPLEALKSTDVAVLAVYGANDSRVNAGMDAVRAALEVSGTTFEIKVYPNANHAFFNDTGSNYNAEAAADAFTTTVAWFKEHLPQG